MRRNLTAAAVAALAVTGCSAGTASTASHPPTSPPPALPSVTYAQAGRICAALNALEHTGSSKAAAATAAAQANGLPVSAVVSARLARCPNL
jgi:hypothetical protein